MSYGSAERFGDAQEYLERMVRRSAQWPGSIVHVWAGAEIIGQLELREHPDQSDAGYVNLFYLAPEYRGMGHGDALHRYVVGFFRDAGLRRAQLRVTPENAAARRYYAKHGWVDLGPDPSRNGRVHLLTLDL